jgi:hypothetical protein
VTDNPETYLRHADRLWVIGGCSCGCDTVDFRHVEKEGQYGTVADAIGTTAGGGTVGVLVFATKAAVASLEVYDLGVAADGIRLPILESIRAWPDREPNSPGT